jgi:hypothetical protein
VSSDTYEITNLQNLSEASNQHIILINFTTPIAVGTLTKIEINGILYRNQTQLDL